MVPSHPPKHALTAKLTPVRCLLSANKFVEREVSHGIIRAHDQAFLFTHQLRSYSVHKARRLLGQQRKRCCTAVRVFDIRIIPANTHTPLSTLMSYQKKMLSCEYIDGERFGGNHGVGSFYNWLLCVKLYLYTFFFSVYYHVASSFFFRGQLDKDCMVF